MIFFEICTIGKCGSSFFFILDRSNIKLIKKKNIPATDFFPHFFLIFVRLKFLSYVSLSSSFVACWNPNEEILGKGECFLERALVWTLVINVS